LKISSPSLRTLFTFVLAAFLLAAAPSFVSAQDPSPTPDPTLDPIPDPTPQPLPDPPPPYDGTPIDAQIVWKNTGTDFNTGTNWVGNVAPANGDVAAFNGAAVAQPNLSVSKSISGLYFTGTGTNGYTLTRSAAAGFTLTGYATTIGAETGDITAVAIGAENTSGTNTISLVPIVLAPAVGSTSTIYQAGGGTLVINSTISGTGINLTKTGGGTLTLTGTNTFNGGITVNGGTLKLDFSASATNNNITQSANTLTLAGGTFSLVGKASTNNANTVNGLTLNSGASAITLNNSTANNLGLTLGAITRNIGSTIDFTNPTGAIGGPNGIGTTTGNTNNIIGGYATVGGTTWAANSGNFITPFSGYVTTFGASANTDITTSSSQSGLNINSLRFNTAAAVTLTLSGTNIIQSGGILETTNVGNNASTITGGTLEGASGKDLVVIQNNTANSLTINSVIANNTTATGLTKSGAGTLIVTGTNTYTGVTTVNVGTLLVNGNNSAATGAVSVTNSGTTLGGTGTIGGAVTISSGANLLGGTGASASGSLTLASSVNTSAGIIELALGPAGAHSTLAHTGVTAWTFGSTQPFTFIDLGAQPGTFYNNIITGLVSDPGTEGSWTITNAGWQGTFTYDGANIDLNLAQIPEPGTWIGGALALVAVSYMQRRRLLRARVISRR
jgi:autotransporter-associated beta strand protein